MPTLPSEPAKLESHQYREVAESFGTNAERYDRTRPSYPDALVAAVVEAAPGPDVLDVGCGTGISSRQFQAAGCRVLGVEVDARMAEYARGTGVETEVAKFEDWDDAGRRFDAVVAGQTWHWVDPVAGAAKAASVLRPGGLLALFWNVFDFPPGLSESFTEVYRAVLPDSPAATQPMPGLGVYSAIFDKVEDGLRAAGGFAEPSRWRFDWERTYTRAEWLDQLPTFGGHNHLPAAKLAELQEGMGAVIDERGGSFLMKYAAVAVTATHP